MDFFFLPILDLPSLFYFEILFLNGSSSYFCVLGTTCLASSRCSGNVYLSYCGLGENNEVANVSGNPIAEPPGKMWLLSPLLTWVKCYLGVFKLQKTLKPPSLFCCFFPSGR